VQALARTRAAVARVWFVTAGAESAPGEGLANPFQAPLWGLARVMRREQAERFFGLIDVSPPDTETRGGDPVSQSGDARPGRAGPLPSREPGCSGRQAPGKDQSPGSAGASPSRDAPELTGLLAEFAADRVEEEVLLRGAARYVHR